ncbi:MAG: PIG-L family deacetylase [Planctomycetota bacterium]
MRIPLLRGPAAALAALVALVGCTSNGEPEAEEIVLSRGGFAPLNGDAPRVLVVVAHPDDELVATGALYVNGARLGGACDVLTITDGQGGFKYAAFAEARYGLELTREEVGRAELPAIRRGEQRRSLEVLGARMLVRLRQTDHRYTQDRFEVLAEDAGVWDLDAVAASLDERLAEEGYDFVVTLAPTATTHGHHQAATLLALRAVARMDPEERPVALCCEVEGAGTPGVGRPPEVLADEPLARLRADAGPFVIDRNRPFGHRGRLTLKAIASVAIAQHLSQGTMLALIGRGDLEEYWVFDVSPDHAEERCAAWFERLQDPAFPERAYGESAGVGASR